MTNLTLNNVSTFVNDTTAVNTVNNNNTAIVTAVGNCLARDAETPNQMNTNLDMNNNQILNLPPPVSANSPARLVDIVSNPSLTLTIPPTGTSGAVVGLLNGNNTYSGISTFTGASSFNPTPTFGLAPATSGQVLIGDGAKWNSVAISGTNTLNSSGVLSPVNSSLTLATLANQPGLSVIANATNVSAVLTPVTGTTRQVLAVSTGGTTLAFAQPQGDQLKGTTTNDAASAGNVGEIFQSIIATGSAVSIPASTNTVNVTSVTLTAGDWDISYYVNFVGTTTTNASYVYGGISITSATMDFTQGHAAGATGMTGTLWTTANGFINQSIYPAGNTVRVSLSGSQQYFLVATAQFSASTVSAFGGITARRAR